ncbi:hypothetical protein TSOC_008840 [Tetrabaena socialis]|uniref:Uncharacterized protein n=1 Tax=Tetrabaena socialis TaxID=47790 RepID=A0A2J7ZXG7_9CHLO|nr:hypothetical protein TSOC_008840 [Tetrabaena socialis]|eukprot:PNH04948.1 hypothetical protein TSOC_008840 [Tetrabaena socialis]
MVPFSRQTHRHPAVSGLEAATKHLHVPPAQHHHIRGRRVELPELDEPRKPASPSMASAPGRTAVSSGAGSGLGGVGYGRPLRAGASGARPRLHYLHWLWSAFVAYWSSVAWVVTLPWRALSWLTPGFLQPALHWVEGTAAWWTGPPARLAADAVYGSLAFVDRLLYGGSSTVSRVHSANMHHWWVSYEAYLRLVQHKAHLVEKHGFDGLWMALNSRTV